MPRAKTNRIVSTAVIAIGALVSGIAGSGCSESQTESTSSTGASKLAVAVSIQPQLYFLQAIGGDRVDARAVLSPGQSHGAFDPSPKQMAALISAKAFFRIGVAFERPLLERLHDANPGIEVIDTRAGIPLLHMDGHHHDEEHEDHECGDGQLDPHIWLDPILVKTQARTMADALRRLDPAHGGDYSRRLDVFESELDDVHARIAALLAPHQGRSIVVFHPSFAYFCERYGLQQVVIETEGKEPGSRRLTDLIQQARSTGARVVFSQTDYSVAGAEAVARAIGARVVRVSPQSADWRSNLLSMASEIARSLSSGDAAPSVSPVSAVQENGL